MSLAYSLAASLAATETGEDLTTLVIDHYTRTIHIPKGITTLGVESDDDVLRLHFKMPRYFGTVDLYNFSIRINYINAEGEDDVYKVTDKTIVGDNITFSWQVGPTATAYKGTTKFNVCMVITDSNSVIKQEYNTAPVGLPVLAGLECSERAVSEYSDILDQWEKQLFGIGDTEEAKMLAFSEEQQENIVNKGAEVLATIPEDYTTAYNLANEGARTKADAIICSAEGEVISVADSSDDYLRGLSIYGKTTQAQTNGYQLFNHYADIFQTTSVGGATLTNNGDGTFTVTGSGSLSASFSKYHYYTHAETVALFKVGTLKLKVVGDNTTPKVFIHPQRNGSAIATLKKDGATTFEITQEMIDDDTFRVVLGIYGDSGTTIGTGTFGVMLYQDGDGTLELYSGGYASPSPEWSQELTSIENPTVDIYSKNLLDFVGIIGDGYTNTLNGLTVTVKDGFATTTGTNTNSGFTNILHVTSIPSDKKVVLPAGTYTTHPSLRVSVVGKITSAWSNKCGTFVFDEPFTVSGFYIAYQANATVNETVPLMLIAGKGVPTVYDEWEQPQSITLAHTLPGILVSSGGNYTDSDGRQWISDETDFERGMYVQRVIQKTFDGTENTWRMHANLYTFMVDWSVATGGWTEGYAKASHFKYSTTAYNNDVGKFAIDQKGLCYFATGHSSLDEFLAWLSANPVTVTCKLITPIETPLTADELAAFQALKTNYPNTTVLNDAGVWTKLRYNADTETWITNLIDEKIAAAVAKL